MTGNTEDRLDDAPTLGEILEPGREGDETPPTTPSEADEATQNSPLGEHDEAVDESFPASDPPSTGPQT